jgi:hypothetical protein
MIVAAGRMALARLLEPINGIGSKKYEYTVTPGGDVGALLDAFSFKGG